MTDTLAPVERTNWALLAWNSTLDRNDVPSAWLYGQDHLWATGHLVSSPGEVFPLPSPAPHPTLPSPPPSSLQPTPWAKIDAHLRKNRLKMPKIKQGTTSKVNCILFNRLLSPVLLNKSGLVRAKAGSFTLKTLNGCFSNYYQVRTWPVFAETVTDMHSLYIQLYYLKFKVEKLFFSDQHMQVCKVVHLATFNFQKVVCTLQKGYNANLLQPCNNYAARLLQPIWDTSKYR